MSQPDTLSEPDYYDTAEDVSSSQTVNSDLVCDRFIDAAFRSSETNVAYIFSKYEYIRLDYVRDEVKDPPQLLCDVDGFPALRGTYFEDCGVVAAFRSSSEEKAFIFSNEDSVLIKYTPPRSIDKGPIAIYDMFPFLEGTPFESNIDAAIDKNGPEAEAYLFNGNLYALINYGPDGKIIRQGLITEGFPSLRSTIFESGIDAAFASHNDNEAYIFKGDSYALINFPTASTDYQISVKKILDNWHSLCDFLPKNNCGVDWHYYEDKPAPEYDSDGGAVVAIFDVLDSDGEPVSIEQRDYKKVKRILDSDGDSDGGSRPKI